MPAKKKAAKRLTRKKAAQPKKTAPKRTAKKKRRGGSQKGQPKKQYDWDLKVATVRKFIDFGDHLTKAAHWAKAPIGTVAGWLQEPRLVREAEAYRKEHAREAARQRGVLARETQTAMLENVSAHRLFTRAMMLDDEGQPIGQDPADWADGTAQRAIASRSELFRQLPRHTRAVAAVHVIVDKLTRLDSGQATEHVELLVGDKGLNAEIQKGLQDPEAMAVLLKRRPDLLRTLWKEHGDGSVLEGEVVEP